MTRKYNDLTGLDKVALLAIILKTEIFTPILQNMKDHEVENISKAIAGLGIVSNEVVEQVLSEFIKMFEEETGIVGSIDTTKELLIKAMDEERANHIIENITSSVWDKFKKLDTMALVDYLKNESPQIIAVVLSKINDMDLVAEIMKHMPEKKAAEVIINLVYSDKVKSDVLNNLESALNKQFSSESNKQSLFIVEIFNNLDEDLEKKITSQLKSSNAVLADYIGKRLFKFADIVKIDNAGMQILLKEIEKEDLKIALRYSNEEIKTAIKSNISERVFRIIQSEIETATEAAASDIKKSMNKIASKARSLITQKKITLKEVKQTLD